MMHGGGRFGLFGSLEEKPKITRNLLMRVLSYGKPYTWQILIMFVLIILTTGLNLITPLILRQLIDHILPDGNTRGLAIAAIALLLIPLITGVISVGQRRLNAQVGEGVIYDLRIQLFAHLQRMSLRFFTNTKLGELMSRLNNDVIGAQNAISNTLVNILTNLIQGVAVLVVMLRLEWRLTLVCLAIMPLFMLAARQMAGKLRTVARQQMDLNAQMNAMMNETLNIGGAMLVKLFGRYSTEVKRFENRAAKVRDTGVKQAVLGAQFFIIIGLIAAVGTALMYGVGGYMVINDTFTIGTIIALGSYLGILYSALSGLVNAPVSFATSMVSFERVFEVIDLPLDIKTAPDSVKLSDVQGELVFDGVTFSYDGIENSQLSYVKRYGLIQNVTTVLSGDNEDGTREKNASHEKGHPETPIGRDENINHPSATSSEESDFSNRNQARPVTLVEINFHVSPGQLVALVGPSGAGKTTLTYMIPRLYDPTSGRILLDGNDLRDINLESLSANIGMVTQESYLFHDTIRTNLLYAKPDATQTELERAAEAAYIHEFINGLPDQYDTIVGERGYRLSGGEKQRIALARVILKNPRILVLDEATSHLDSESEGFIQQALKHVMAGRTSIVIAHRLSTILAADMILVLDRGKIVEQGTHEELLSAEGLYAQLYHTQFSQQHHLA